MSESKPLVGMGVNTDFNETLSIDTRCGTPVWTNLRLWGTLQNVPQGFPLPPLISPFTETTDSGCMTTCSGYGWVGWTRKLSTNQCSCIDQPLSKSGTDMTGELNADYHTGFFPNVSPPTAGCASFQIAYQKIMSSTYYGPQSKSTNALCSSHCWSNGYPLWTRIYDSNNCYCFNFLSSFNLKAIQYDSGSNAAMGVNSAY